MEFFLLPQHVIRTNIWIYDLMHACEASPPSPDYSPRPEKPIFFTGVTLSLRTLYLRDTDKQKNLQRWLIKRILNRKRGLKRDGSVVRELPVLPKDPSSVLSTAIRRLTPSCKSSSRGSEVLFWPLWTPKHTHKHKNKYIK